MAKGGYVVLMKNGAVSYVLGDSVTPYIQYRANNIANELAAPTGVAAAALSMADV